MASHLDIAPWFGLTDGARGSLEAATVRAAADRQASSWRDRYAAAMERAMGSPSERPELAELVTEALSEFDDELRQQLPLIGLADALGAAVDFVRGRGIDDDVVRATLADVGRTERKNHLWFGRPGLDGELAVWLNRHLYGAIFQLGRLQFERVAVGGHTADGIRAAGRDVADGERALSLHIPAGLGPLTPAAVDESMALAGTFFARHFPDERPRYAVCISWLLDPQLGDYLPATSNIVSFQRRFTLGPVDASEGHSDDVVRRFVFGESRTPLAQQPATSTLERAIHAHLGSARHFATRRGFVAL